MALASEKPGRGRLGCPTLRESPLPVPRPRPFQRRGGTILIGKNDYDLVETTKCTGRYLAQ